jgi:hypothetical protein
MPNEAKPIIFPLLLSATNIGALSLGEESLFFQKTNRSSILSYLSRLYL